MDGALTAITLLSLGTTGAVLYYAARLLREDRERSEARVVALADEIQRSRGPEVPADSRRSQVHEFPERARAWESSEATDGGDVRLVPVMRTSTAGDASVAPDASRSWPPADAGEDGADAAGRGDARTTRLTASLFDHQEPEEERGLLRRWLIPVIGALVVGLVLALVYAANTGGDDGDNAATSATAQAPLELLSLRHTKGAAAITVSGLVRNPRAGGTRAGLAAVVFLFDKDGAFLASGRAALDYQSLAPGDESPFIVSVPVTGQVGRYRVSFRDEAAVVPHVDGRDGVRVAEK